MLTLLHYVLSASHYLLTFALTVIIAVCTSIVLLIIIAIWPRNPRSSRLRFPRPR